MKFLKILKRRKTNSIFFKVVCLAGNIDVVQELIKDGADINSRDDLFIGKKGEKDNVPYNEIRKSSYVNRYTVKTGRTALAYAVKRRYIELVELLCNNGADVNARSLRGAFWTETLSSSTYNQTPLMDAASNDSMQIAKILVTHGAVVDMKDTNGNTALFYAATMHYKLELVKFLIESGADINILNNSEKSIIELLYEEIKKAKGNIQTIGPYTFKDVLSVAEYLVVEGADLKKINISKEEFKTLTQESFNFCEDEIKNKNWYKD